jgi:hypothetical protein
MFQAGREKRSQIQKFIKLTRNKDELTRQWKEFIVVHVHKKR